MFPFSELTNSIIVLLIGIFSITSNSIGISTYNKNNIKKDISFYYLCILLAPSIIVTLLGIFGLYINITKNLTNNLS